MKWWAERTPPERAPATDIGSVRVIYGYTGYRVQKPSHNLCGSQGICFIAMYTRNRLYIIRYRSSSSEPVKTCLAVYGLSGSVFGSLWHVCRCYYAYSALQYTFIQKKTATDTCSQRRRPKGLLSACTGGPPASTVQTVCALKISVGCVKTKW